MPQLTGFSMTNFRVFKDPVDFDLVPFTILTGKNSSGKSTLLKALLLMDDNLQKEKWQEVDFSDESHSLGSFRFSRNDQSDKKEMIFSYQIDFSKNLQTAWLSKKRVDLCGHKDVRASFFFGPGIEENGSVVRFTIEANGVEIFKIEPASEEMKTATAWLNLQWFMEEYRKGIKRLSPGKIKRFKPIKNQQKLISMEELKKQLARGKVLSFFRVREYEKLLQIDDVKDSVLLEPEPAENKKEKGTNEVMRKAVEEILLLVAGFVKLPEDYARSIQALDQKIEVESIQGFWLEVKKALSPGSGTTSLGYSEFFIGDCKVAPESVESEGTVLTFNGNQLNEIQVRDVVKPGFFVFLEWVKKEIDAVFKYLKEIELIQVQAIRASSKRIYGQEKEATGFNFILHQMRIHPLNKSDLDFVNKWIKEFGIAEEFILESVEGVASKVILREGKRKMVLTDMGYGITQLLPILLSIVLHSESKAEGEKNPPRKLFLIEEPESNLHPALQSKLAELFLDAYRTFRVQFVIETHSEYMIRSFQNLVAKREIPSGDVLVYYVDKNEAGVGKANRIPVNEDGSMDYRLFGSGFFDETQQLELSLLNIQRARFYREFKELQARAGDSGLESLQAFLDAYTQEKDLDHYRKQVLRWLPADHGLEEATITFLASGEFLMAQLQGHPDHDFSPAVLQYSRAVEDFLWKKGFLEFRNSYPGSLSEGAGSRGNRPDLIHQVFRDAGFPPMLGPMIRLLRRLTKSGDDLRLDNRYQSLKSFLTEHLPALLDLDYLARLNRLRRDYRNRAAHPDWIGEEEAHKCQTLLREIFQLARN